jgi:copper transporter 1
VPAPRPAPRGWDGGARLLLSASFALGLLLLLLRLALSPTAPQEVHSHAHSAMDGMSMQMTFTWSTHVTLWFASWSTHGPGEYAFALSGLAALCVFQEALHTWRARLAAAAADGCAERRDRKPWGRAKRARGARVCSAAALPGVPSDSRGCLSPAPPRITHSARSGSGSRSGGATATLDTALYAAHVLCSYMLMLAVMSFNGGVLLTVVAGMAGGRALLGRQHRPSGGSGGGVGTAQHASRVAGEGASETDRLLGDSGSADACCAPSTPAGL